MNELAFVLQREPTQGRATLGKLTCDGVFMCDTLEDQVRQPADWKAGDPVDPWKVKAETAIPTGKYRIRLTYSERFKRTLPILENVPGFAGIRIHPGNTHEDTEGCILTGKRMGPSTVVDSRIAFLTVYGRIQDALNAGKTVFIDVRSP